MTNREFYTAVANEMMTAEVIDFAKEAIVKMDERNAKRNSKPSKTAIANEPIKVAILEYLEGKEDVPAAEIATACDISTNKASALCVQLVADGKLSVKDIKVPKKGKCKGYTLATEEE